MESLGFSSFRSLIDQCDEAMDTMDLMSQIRSAIDGHGLCFFFVKDGSVFGGPEDSRMSFARMKHPDPEEGTEDGDFMGLSLDDILGGQMSQRIFNRGDIDDLQIIDQDAAADHVTKKHKAKKKPEKKKDKK